MEGLNQHLLNPGLEFSCHHRTKATGSTPVSADMWDKGRLSSVSGIWSDFTADY